MTHLPLHRCSPKQSSERDERRGNNEKGDMVMKGFGPPEGREKREEGNRVDNATHGIEASEDQREERIM